MTRIIGTLVSGALLLAIASVPARAQATAELNGRVTDESGAVLPGVTVTATQTDTGFTRTVVTDDTGTYAMPNLPTGPYRLEVALQGFRTYVQTGIVLQVGGTPTINAVLAVGNLEETVSVEAAAPIVDVRSAGISEVVEQERIVELPLQGRQVTDLIVLAGAAVQTGRPNTRNFQGGVDVSVAGGLSFGVAYFLDGALHLDPQNTASMPLPFPDALQEFRVATSGLSAENGMRSGAAVNAVTKSGTNTLHGNGFEFIRDKRFNATNPFARVGPDGTRLDDGLRRHQFGGTVGGPVVRDRLFFFGGYQGTVTRVAPADTLAYVPTPAMLAGDFTTFASPQCNAGRQVTLRAPFVNNRIDPAQLSPAALNLASRLPQTTDPCGEIRFRLPNDRDEGQVVARADYQLSTSNSIFGRYMATFDKKPSGLSKSDNILTTVVPNIDNLAQSLTLGNTKVFGANSVNSLRFAYNRGSVNRFNEDYFQPSDLGIKAYNYSPTREIVVQVTGGFDIARVTATRGRNVNNSFQVSDDLTLVRGRHQLAMGVNLAYWKSEQRTYANSPGWWTFSGQITGLGLADFLLGRVTSLQHGAFFGLTMGQLYQGYYVQDTWRMTDRVTVNGGLRWEPYSGQQVLLGSVSNFSLEGYKQGTKSSMFRNAPPGFTYPGDPGFPPGRSGHDKQWLNLSPRVGLAWDVNGDGRTAVRTSYGIAYDFPPGDYLFNPLSGPPYGNQLRLTDPPGRFDDPYGHLGGDPHPIETKPDMIFPPSGGFGALTPDINAPRSQSWNITLERQLGSNWGASVSYLGSHSDRLWGAVQANPGVFLGLGPCTLNGIAYPVCSTDANLNNRRVLSLENPREGQLVATVELWDDVGSQSYHGMKVSAQHRTSTGISLNGNYTWGRCVGLEMVAAGPAGGYVNPANPDYDRGHCTADRTHIANLTLGYLTPRFAGAAARILASNWRVSGIVNARSGSWLTITTGRDLLFNGQANQRVDQVSDEVYGDKTLNNYLNRNAFAQPAPGVFGTHVRNSVKGPAFWKADVAVSRLFGLGASHNLEVRIEAFNVLNRFNWGNPTTNFNSATFGRIQTLEGDPRILQFGVKYAF